MNVPVSLFIGASQYKFPSFSVSVDMGNSLDAGRILDSSFQDGQRVSGPMTAKVSVNFAACTASGYNAASGILADMTGNNSGTLQVGGVLFSGAFLESASVTIEPHMPVVMSADFAVYQAPTGASFSGSGSYFSDSLTGRLCYGWDTVITNGDRLTDGNNQSVSYKVSCSRTPSFSLGQVNASRVFLDGVEKEVSIRATNIWRFINHTGSGQPVVFNLYDELGNALLGGGLTMGSGARIVSQNLSKQDNDIVNGEISLREIVR